MAWTLYHSRSARKEITSFVGLVRGDARVCLAGNEVNIEAVSGGEEGDIVGGAEDSELRHSI